MKAFYLCRVIPDPDGGWTTAPMLMTDFSVTSAGIKIVAGVPDPAWVLCHVAGRDLTAINAHPDCIPVPVVSKDARLDTVATDTFRAFADRIEAAGLTRPARRAQDSMRDLLNTIGRTGSKGAAFDVDAHEVADRE